MRQLKINKQFTNRENKSLDKYLNEISRVPMITADEEVELAKRIREGDQRSFEKLVNANLRFVVSVAKQYQNQGMILGDIINEGNLGLIKAAKRFDETRGFKFISYAVWWIRQAILQALADNSRMIRIPLNKVTLTGKVMDIRAKLEQIYEREPTDEEIANSMDISLNDIRLVLMSNNRHVSLDAPTGEEGVGILTDFLDTNDEAKPDEDLLITSKKEVIIRLVQKLKDGDSNNFANKDYEVIKYYFGLDDSPELSLEEISERIGLTRERIRQIKEKALRRLKKITKSYPMIKEYLD
ncbi:MAG: polymerase primary sigma factor [Bacteroidota bacterium]|nr:polymerase primary sigma factor [Bacteroidota bacterium]